MLKTTLAAALVFGASTLPAQANTEAFLAARATGAAFGHDHLLNRPFDVAGTYMTTPDGCSYVRAQAPGYAPTWHLILNPHHIGQPSAHRGCAALLRG